MASIEDIRTWINGSGFRVHDLPKVWELRRLFNQTPLDEKRIIEVYNAKGASDGD